MPAKFFVFCFLIVAAVAQAQTDTVRPKDSVQKSAVSLPAVVDSVKKDSVIIVKKVPALTWHGDTAFNKFFYNKKLPKNKQSVFAVNAIRQPSHEDEQFYILAGLLLFAGIIRALFPKYFTTLFQVFFQSSQHQRQSKESMAQDALPSFLMNIFFVFSSGLLVSDFVKGDDFPYHLSFPLLWLYTCAALAAVYIFKSLFITFFGWAFSAQEPAANYRFIVFLVNKIAGLCFVPLLLIITYSTGADLTVFTTIAIAISVILLLYRYIISLSTVGKKLKINPLHFFLYLCAAEILPLLITYKVLLITKEL